MNALQKLIATGFHEDLCETLHGFATNTHNHFLSLGMQDGVVQDLVGNTAEYFANQYLVSRAGVDFTRFEAECSDWLRDTKMRYLGAIQKLHDQFGDRLPAIVYATLAFAGTRENPHTEVMLPDIQEGLQKATGSDWQSADSVLHALPKCSRLNLLVLSLINEATGSVLMHGCGCNHVIPAMGEYVVKCAKDMDAQTILDESESLLRHMLGDMVLLKLGMPRIIGVFNRAERTQREWFFGKTVLRQVRQVGDKTKQGA